jgi:hypothetical protein
VAEVDELAVDLRTVAEKEDAGLAADLAGGGDLGGGGLGDGRDERDLAGGVVRDRGEGEAGLDEGGVGAGDGVVEQLDVVGGAALLAQHVGLEGLEPVGLGAGLEDAALKRRDAALGLAELSA